MDTPNKSKQAADDFLKEQRIAKEQQLNRVTMLQIITAKIEKIFQGKRYSLELVISALAIMIAKAIAAGPREAHGTMLMQVAKTIHDSVLATYGLPLQVKGSDGSTPDKPTDANGVPGAETSKATH